MKNPQKIQILQNLIVNPIMKTKIAPSSEKTDYKRQTSSMYLLDEIPVFSDTEDEEEYTNRVLNDFNLTVLPSNSKRRDVAIQCDIPIDSDVMNLIKVCSTLQTNRDRDLNNLIELCKILAEKYGQHSEIQSSQTVESNFGQTQPVLFFDKPLIEGIPHSDITSTFLSPKLLTTNQDVPSRLQCVESFNKSNHFDINEQNVSVSKICKIPSVKNKIQKKVKKNSGIIPRRSTRRSNIPKKFNDCSVFKKPEELPKTLPHKTQESSFPTVTGTLENNSKQSAIESVITDNLYINNSSTVIKRLARSWVNPNKSLDSKSMVDTNKQFYASLQHTNKARRLYSPTEWLLSQDFEQSCPCITNPIRTIFG